MNAYTDNVLRFALLGWVGSEMACGLDPFWRPEVVHAHDWHAGLTPAYLAARGRPAKSVSTVHNLAYQGMFYSWHMNEIELPWSFYNMHGLEFNGQIWFAQSRAVLCRLSYHGGESNLRAGNHRTAICLRHGRVAAPAPTSRAACPASLTASMMLSGIRKAILLLAARYDRESAAWKRRPRINGSCKSPWG